jgi:hypothetical protein
LIDRLLDPIRPPGRWDGPPQVVPANNETPAVQPTTTPACVHDWMRADETKPFVCIHCKAPFEVQRRRICAACANEFVADKLGQALCDVCR